ncbi:MAG: protein BatD, partial [Flavobacterium sp.]|nr:protein BatD [Flavobacterium sp.]
MKKYIILFLISFQALLAQVQFEAKVSKTKLGLNERLRVDFTMNADGDNFAPPTFDGFRVVGGPFQQMSQQWINGRGSFSKAYSYILLPSQKGILTIKQASVEINGQVYKTIPVKINVTNAIEIPKDPNDVQVSADNELHLVADISKTNPYINEPITVVYKLYFSNNIGITNSQELEKPKYNDFWSQNIDIKQLTVEQSTYNGENYRCVVLKKVILYPQKSGKLTIEPLSLDLDLQLPTNRRNIFGQIQITEGNKRVSAGAKTINVKPLPEKGKPIVFSGGVGKLNFSAIPSKTTLKHGESFDLIIKVSGNGNLKLFDLPKPVVPSALEMYEPVHSENVSTPLSGMTGSISDKYTIIPDFKGNYPIKAMSFTYFDLGSNSYKTITSPEIMIKVLDGPNEVDSVSVKAENQNNSGKRQVLASNQFQYIKLKTRLI